MAIASQTLKPVSYRSLTNCNATSIDTIADSTAFDGGTDSTYITAVNMTSAYQADVNISLPIDGTLNGNLVIRFYVNTGSTQALAGVWQGTTEVKPLAMLSSGTGLREITLASSLFPDASGEDIFVRFSGNAVFSGSAPAFLYALEVVADVESVPPPNTTPQTLKPVSYRSLSNCDATSIDAIADNIAFEGGFDSTYITSIDSFSPWWANINITEIVNGILNGSVTVRLHVETGTTQAFVSVYQGATEIISPVELATGRGYREIVLSSSLFPDPTGKDIYVKFAGNSTVMDGALLLALELVADVETTIIVGDSPPVLSDISPETQFRININEHTFVCRVSDADLNMCNYTFQIAEDPSFTANLYEYNSTFKNSGTLVGFKMPGMTRGGKYWRFRGNDNSGESSPFMAPRIIYIDTPIAGKCSPDAIKTQTNLNGTISSLYTSNDGNIMSPASIGLSSELRVSFTTPADLPASGVDLQSLRVHVRKNDAASVGHPQIEITAFEGATILAQTIFFDVTNTTTGVIYFLKWNAINLVDPTGADVELRLKINPYIGKGKEISSSVTIDLIEWEVTSNYFSPPITETLAPVPIIVSLSKNKISDELGMNSSTLIFKFDINVVEWKVNVMGADHSTGLVADSGLNVPANTEISAIIDWTELYQEGQNRINVYGKSESGDWTLYEG